MMTTTPPKLRCSRSDVVLVLFPNSDLRTAKLRPALVVQADDLQTGLPQLIVAMITSNLARAKHPSRVLIQRKTRMGSQARSVMLIDSNIIIYATKPEHDAIRRFIAEYAPAVSAVSYVEHLVY